VKLVGVRVAAAAVSPDSIAGEYWHMSQQPKDCWTFQSHIQTASSDMSLL